MCKFLFPDTYFNSAVSVVLAHEGGLTNNPNDPGGITDYGISLKFLRAAGIDGNGNRSNHITEADIKALNPDKAKAIYRKYFWQKYNLDKIHSLTIATSMLDMIVLMGAEAIHLMQNVLGLSEDGIIGTQTLYAINEALPYPLNNKFKQKCIEHFKYLCATNPKLQVFLSGWENRVNSL